MDTPSPAEATLTKSRRLAKTAVRGMDLVCNASHGHAEQAAVATGSPRSTVNERWISLAGVARFGPNLCYAPRAAIRFRWRAVGKSRSSKVSMVY